MKPIDLQDFAQAVGGKIISQQTSSFTNISTDSRSLKKGELFLALKGEAFDAHDFIQKAIEGGASGVVTHVPLEPSLSAKTTVVLVKDTLAALQDFAHHRRLQSKSLVVGITGSNGKTTSKEFCYAVISPNKKTHYNQGSFNNHWGVPLTLLAAPEGTEVTIAEMGMNHPGELRTLCQIAEPNIVVCTTVGRAHIGHFKNLEEIAQAKSEIYETAPQCIFNLDNIYTLEMYKKFAPQKKKVFTFSSEKPSADIFMQVKNITMSSLEIEGHILNISGSAKVNVFGAHNITNLMTAAAVALAVGLSPEVIWKNLSLCKTNWGRNQLVHTEIGADILFDGYNANPDSMSALLDNFKWIKSPGKKYAVFGEMLEMGEEAEKVHYELGQKAAMTNFERVWFIGSTANAFKTGFESAQGEASKKQKNLVISKSYEDALALELVSVLQPEDVVLVKGSRGMKLERFVTACRPLHFLKS